MSLADDVPGCVDPEEIGAGGYGRVYKVRQPAFDRVVAVKILNGRLDDADTVRRFQRECRAIGAVAGHPNIVGVHDAGETPSGHPYIVMPYLRRGSLADRLRRETVPWQQAVQVGVKIAGALHSAHRAGVLHRDIKPENILVSDYGEPQLADFGIAQRLGSIISTATASALTPAQGAPELLTGERPSVASDVYGLASTIHTLVRGEPPFVRRGEEAVFPMLARIATEPPPDLRAHGVPDAVARVVEHAMAKSPHDRPASALAFGKALQAAEASLGLPVTVLPLAETDDDPATADDTTRPRLRQPWPPQPWQDPGPGQTPGSGPDPYPATAAQAPGPGYPTPPTTSPPRSAAYPPPVQQYAPGHEQPWASQPDPYQVPAAPAPARPVAAPPRKRRSAARTALVGLLAVAAVAAGAGLLVARLRQDGPGPDGTRTSDRIRASLLGPSELGAGWEVVDADPGDQGFCHKPLDVGSQDRAAVTLRRASPPAVVSQQAARRPGGVAAKLLTAVRTSAKGCTRWSETEDGASVIYTVTTASRARRIGDDSTTYLVTRRSAEGEQHFVQVYATRAEVLTVVSYGTVAATTDADVRYAVDLARAGVDRLAPP